MHYFTETCPDPGKVQRIAIAYDGIIYGGVEVYILSLLQTLDLKRYIPSLIISSHNYPFCPPRFIEEVKALGIKVLTPPQPAHSRFFNTAKDIKDLADILKREKFDILHLHTSSISGGRRVTLAARLAGVPKVLRTEHVPPRKLSAFSKVSVKFFDRLTDCIIVDSDGNRREQIEVAGRNPKKTRRYHCGIDLSKFEPHHDVLAAKITLGLDPKIPVIGAVGRLTEQKGHIYLIKAASTIIKKYGPVNFLLVGNGPLEEQLKEQVAQLGLTKYFHFVGFQADYLPYIKAMDIAAMPSIYEGFSLSMLEFMAMAKPMVVNNHSSFEEALENGESGLIVSVENSNDLANAVLTLLCDQSLGFSLGQNALQRVRTYFSIQRLANDMMELYDALLRNQFPLQSSNPTFSVADFDSRELSGPVRK